MRQLDKDQQGALQQSAFRPLQQTAFQALQHSASLKGLLKPFKGKGELAQLAEQCEVLEQGLLELAQGLLAQVRRPPFTLLPTRLIEQRTSARTTFLRWQNIASRRMGVGVWTEMLRQDKTPEYLLQDLYEMELQRITLNMQISLIHSIGKQAAE
ncbi:DUF3158 family protein, partial [Pseudomonas aeruginosa]|nr:DUF3158 family protein [Pseudomonas aeruginosa]